MRYGLWARVVRAADDGGAGGGNPVAPAAGGEGGRLAAAAGAPVNPAVPANPAKPAPGTPPQNPAPAQLYRPEGIAEHYLGKTDQETIDGLWKAVKGYRDADAKRGPMPKAAEEYTFAAPDALKGYFTKPEDPAMKAAQAAALKHGLSTAQYQGFISDVFAPLVEAGALAPPFDPLAELKSISKALGHAETRDGAAATQKAVGEADAYAKGLAQQLGLDETMTASLAALADTAAGTVFFTKLAGVMGNKGPQLGGAGAVAGPVSKEDLRAWSQKPEIDPNSPKYDERERSRYDEAYRKFYGGK